MSCICRRLSFTVLFLSAYSVSMVGEAAPEGSGEATTQAFYGWILSRPHISLPSAVQRKQLAAFLTPALVALLKQTSEAETRCIAATPAGFKLLLFKGSLLVGNYEGANEVAYGDWRRTAETASVDVNLMAIDGRLPKGHRHHRPITWRDRVTLQRVGKRWLISDITVNIGSAEPSSVTAYLKQYVAVDSKTCGNH